MKTNERLNPPEFSAIFLMAGNSTRFGKTKAFLNFNSSQSFLQKLVNEYIAAGITEILLIINDRIAHETKVQIEKIGVTKEVAILINTHPDQGKLSSVLLGLKAIQPGNSIFLQNPDNPFTTKSLLEQMMNANRKGKYIVPVYDGNNGHPVLLSFEMASLLFNEKDMNANMQLLLPKSSRIAVETDDKQILANINTSDEYAKYFQHE